MQENNHYFNKQQIFAFFNVSYTDGVLQGTIIYSVSNFIISTNNKYLLSSIYLTLKVFCKMHLFILFPIVLLVSIQSYQIPRYYFCLVSWLSGTVHIIAFGSRFCTQELLDPIFQIISSVDHTQIYTQRSSLCNVLYELLITHLILLIKFHSQQNMLIYMNGNLKLLNRLVSEFHLS